MTNKSNVSICIKGSALKTLRKNFCVSDDTILNVNSYGGIDVNQVLINKPFGM